MSTSRGINKRWFGNHLKVSYPSNQMHSKSSAELWNEVQHATGEGVTVFVIDGDMPTKELDGVLDGNFIGYPFGSQVEHEFIIGRLPSRALSHSSVVLSVLKGAQYSLVPDAKVVYILKSTQNDHYDFIHHLSQHIQGPIVITTSCSYNYSLVCSLLSADLERELDCLQSNAKIKALKETRNIPVFCAAGNEGLGEPPKSHIPFSCPEVISVGSFKASYSNYGDWVDFYTFSEFVMNFYRYDRYPNYIRKDNTQGLMMGSIEGTSIAAPVVASVAVRLLELYPWLTVPQLTETMKRLATVHKVTSPKGEIYHASTLIHECLVLSSK